MADDKSVVQPRGAIRKKKLNRGETASAGNPAPSFVITKASLAKPPFNPQEEGCSDCGRIDHTEWSDCSDLGVMGGGPGVNCRVESAVISTAYLSGNVRFSRKSIVCEQDRGSRPPTVVLCPDAAF